MSRVSERRRENVVVAVAKSPQIGVNKEKVEEDQAMAVGGVEEESDFEEDEWEYPDESDVYLRSKFFESWLWKTVSLPAQADRDG